MTRRWYSTNTLPLDNQKVYYFSKNLGMFRGRYYYDPETVGNPNKFHSDYGIVDSDDISHWMPYVREEKNKIPLPPDYETDFIELDNNQQTFTFSYTTTAGDLIP